MIRSIIFLLLISFFKIFTVYGQENEMIMWGNVGNSFQSKPITQISVGQSHFLALQEDSTVIGWSWLNDYGEATIPSDLKGVVEVAAGTHHSLALLSDGTVTGWGANYGGQISIPIGLDSVVKVAAGHRHSLALKKDGSIVSWGEMEEEIPNNLPKIKQISAGYNNSMALSEKGDFFAWGFNNYKQNDLPVGVDSIIDISTGYQITYVLKKNGTVIAWGNNSNIPTSLPEGLSNVKKIVAGTYNGIALLKDSTAVIFGADSLIINSLINHPYNDIIDVGAGKGFVVLLRENGNIVILGKNLALPKFIKDIREISIGYLHYVVVDNNDNAHSFGSFNGLYSNETQNSIPKLTEIKTARASWSHSVFLRNDGSVTEMGRKDSSDQFYAKSLSNIEKVGCGDNFSVALDNEGEIFVWGKNNFNQKIIPKSESKIVNIDVGHSHILALTENGNVIAWGDTSFGKTNIPLELKDVIGISAGFNHSLALTVNGNVIAWGDTSMGKTNVPTLNNIVSISAGRDHSIALTEEGKVIIWGEDFYTFYRQDQETPLLPNANFIEAGWWSSAIIPGLPKPLALPEIEKINQNYIFPNPTKNEINFQKPISGELIISNIMGQKLYSYQIDNSIKKIDISKLASGLYLIQLKTDDSLILLGDFIK